MTVDRDLRRASRPGPPLLPAPVDPASERAQVLVREVTENHRAVRARLAREAAAATTRTA